MDRPRPYIPAPRKTLSFDFPALAIGVAEYREGPTGCTAFHFPAGVPFSADVRGGANGTIGADYSFAHAFCFAGGSLVGLEAAAGVASALFERRGREQVEWNDVPLVAGAITYDFGGRSNGIYPDRELGRAALEAALTGSFPLGSVGAGVNAGVGKSRLGQPERSGQGGAFRQVGPVKVAAFTVVNAIGAIHDRDGRVVRGNYEARTGKRHSFLHTLDAGESETEARRGENTTLTLVVTNQKLRSGDLTQLSRQVHASMARAIQPFHTPFDGDVLFFATTNEVDHAPLATPPYLGVLASEVVWDAVLTCCDEDTNA